MWLSGDHGRLIKWHQPDNFAFVERSGTMKAPVGLLSDRTVLRQQDGGASPRQVRVCGAKRNNESPSGAFKRPNGLAAARWRGLAPTSSRLSMIVNRDSVINHRSKKFITRKKVVLIECFDSCYTKTSIIVRTKIESEACQWTPQNALPLTACSLPHF